VALTERTSPIFEHMYENMYMCDYEI